MDKQAITTTKAELSPEELQAVLRMRNKRSASYNLRVSDKEMVFLDTIQKEVEAAGTRFDSRTDFVVHCAQSVAALTKSQTKLL